MRSSEDSELIKVFDWLTWQSKNNPILNCIFHVANERKCTPAYGARLKRKGVRSGVPDIVCPIPRGDYHGLWIEMKAKTGRVSEKQKEFMILLHGQGHKVVVAWSGDDAIQLLKDYLRG